LYNPVQNGGCFHPHLSGMALNFRTGLRFFFRGLHRGGPSFG
jgi:hypothetical protein